MAKYTLAFVIERYFEFGGLQRDMRRLARACAEAGHDVKVFTSKWDGLAEQLFGIEIVDFRSSSNHKTVKKIEDFVRSLRKKNKFDCITGFHRMRGLDVYFCGDTCLKAKLQRNNRTWLRFLPRYRTYLEMEDAVFGRTSNTDIMLLSAIELENIQRIYKTASERIYLLPPGIDRDRLTAEPLVGERRTQFRSEFGIREDDFMILTVGSSFRTKGIDRSIHAIASLPDALKKRCHYVVVGLGKYRKFSAIAQRADIGDRISFAGGHEDISNFYYAADMLIHPARTENTGTTLLEAMVTSLPVIATGNCGYARYINEAKGGQVCREPFEQVQLNEALCEILANDQARIQYGQNGQDYCETADIYNMIEEGVRVIVGRAMGNRGGK
jgi:UDP-glucose:(heptosyl)LPS alpha-1,3-glucosyltransferase